ncbi:MAG: hypothetical protein ACO3XL_11465, partial [Gemmobacter sp.]
MSLAPDLPDDPALLAALIAWQAELGADEPIGDAPVDRFALPAAAAPAAAPAAARRAPDAPPPAPAPAAPQPGADLAAAVA